MFYPHLVAVLLLEIANIDGIPQLRCNTEILAASQQRIRLAAFASGGDRVGAKVLALAARLGNEAVAN